MVQRRFHYEKAFEHYLRTNHIAYIAVDEAKRTLLRPDQQAAAPRRLKAFDFVVYTESSNQLIDVKGRKCRVIKKKKPNQNTLLDIAPERTRVGRLDSWVTLDDVESLTKWEELFGNGFKAYFVFLYWCESQPADALFQEIFSFDDRWYALRSVPVDLYQKHMKQRSAKWGTVDIPVRDFEVISSPVTLHQC